MTAFIEPITLSDRHAALEPLAYDHHDGLAEAVRDGDLWRLWYTAVPSPEGMRDEIERRLGLQQAGSMLPFAVRSRASGKLVGMTTYMNIDAKNRRVEIGSTWYAKSAQRTPLNTACKMMLLGHAFETLDCIAVEFRTGFSISPAAARSNAWGRSRMAYCAATSAMPTAVCATPWSFRSLRRNGRR